MIRRLIVSLAAAVVTLHAGQVLAQGGFPAPLPSQAGQVGTVNDPAFPPVNGAAPSGFGAPPQAPFPGGAPMTGAPFTAPPTQTGAIDDCMKKFLPLRQEAEKRGQALKAASEKHASPDIACKLLGGFADSELKMLKFVESHATQCQIPPQIGEQLKKGHQGTETMRTKVCAAAAQVQQGPTGPSLSEVLGSATTLPESKGTKKSGGSTFDTLNGNVLQTR